MACLLGALFQDGVKMGDDQLAHRGEGGAWQCDGGPVILDQLFGSVGLDGYEGAAVLPGLASEAVEVFVVVTQAVAADFVAER